MILTRCFRPALIAAAALALALTTTASAAAPAGYQLESTWHLGGTGGWDCATVDHQTHRLYVTRGSHVQVIDTATGKLTADITGLQRAHDVALVPAVNRGFITDGGAAVVVVIDLKTDAVLGRIPAAPDADIALYDPASDRVLVACGDAHKLLAFAPTVDLKSPHVDTLDLGAAPEFPVADGQGKAFVNLSDISQIAAVDLKDMKIVAHYPLAPGVRPTGLAYDTADGLLFSACRNGKLMALHAADGKVEAALPIAGGADGAAFVHGAALASCGEGSLVVAEAGADGHWSVVATPATAQGARTMAVDETTGTVYLPSAKFEAPSADSSRRRPQAVPDSFEIIVMAPTAKPQS